MLINNTDQNSMFSKITQTNWSFNAISENNVPLFVYE